MAILSNNFCIGYNFWATSHCCQRTLASTANEVLVVIDPEITDHLTAEEVLDLVLSKTEVEVMLKAPLQGLTKNYKGKGFVTSFSLSTPAGDNSTYNYSITGSGDLAAATKA